MPDATRPLPVDWSPHVERLIDQLLDSDYTGARFPLARVEQPEIALVELLGQIGDRRAVPALLLVLENGHPGVRPGAADALRRIGDPAAFGPLCRQVSARFTPPTVFAAARAMATLAGPDHLHDLASTLRKLYGDPRQSHHGVSHAELARIARDEIVWKLGALGNPNAAQILLFNTHSAVAPDALAALGPAALPAMLHALLPFETRDVCAAIEGFVRMGTPARVVLEHGLHQCPPVFAARCALALCRMGHVAPETVTRLGPAVEDRVTADLAIRTVAVIAETRPCPELRAVLPSLRSVRRSWLVARPVRAAAASALERVLQVTAEGHDLPRAVAGLPESASALPTPASPAALPPDRLPRAATSIASPPANEAAPRETSPA